MPEEVSQNAPHSASPAADPLTPFGLHAQHLKMRPSPRLPRPFRSKPRRFVSFPGRFGVGFQRLKTHPSPHNLRPRQSLRFQPPPNLPKIFFPMPEPEP
jgi:hypothetical protein